MPAKTKLIIQIPCYNEASTLPMTLAELPRKLDGIDVVEWLVIDDGSEDGTAEIALQHGVDHVIRHDHNRGLAVAFMTGLDACLRRDASIIVNTDADNQYSAGSIPRLIQPILDGSAEIVIGDRQVSNIRHFSIVKRFLQWLGSAVVRYASGTKVPDAPSGFRAIRRSAAERLNVFNSYTYTLETIIQAGQSNMKVVSVPVETNDPTRASKLVRNIYNYVYRSMVTILGIFMVYRPLQTFLLIGSLFLLPGILLGIRYLALIAMGGGQGNIQSLILATILIVVGCFISVTGLVAQLIAINRKLLQEIRTRLIRVEHVLDADTLKSIPDIKPNHR